MLERYRRGPALIPGDAAVAGVITWNQYLE
jgi:hypothetical protein